jgi:hypothetical protein
MVYAEVCDDDRSDTVAAFRERALDWFLARGIVSERLLTDNPWAYTRTRSCAS